VTGVDGEGEAVAGETGARGAATMAAGGASSPTDLLKYIMY
jgi:hypothetical protein